MQVMKPFCCQFSVFEVPANSDITCDVIDYYLAILLGCTSK